MIVRRVGSTPGRTVSAVRDHGVHHDRMISSDVQRGVKEFTAAGALTRLRPVG
jgi:hypothetical protein